MDKLNGFANNLENSCTLSVDFQGTISGLVFGAGYHTYSGENILTFHTLFNWSGVCRITITDAQITDSAHERRSPQPSACLYIRSSVLSTMLIQDILAENI